MHRLLVLFASLVALGASARAQPAPDPQPPADQPPPADPQPPADQPPPAASPPAAPVATSPPPSPSQSENKADQPPSVQGKWSTTLYGFAEGDLIIDSVQGPAEGLGNGALPRPAVGTTPATYASQHGQNTVSARNSRIGFRFTAPAVDGMKASGQIEADFLGNQPAVSEASLFGNATLRLRHANFKLETPVIDLLIGQYWHLFGWQALTQPGSIQYQGLPGYVNARTQQVRLSKAIKTDSVGVEIAVAASRPAHRAGGLPDGTAGLKLTLDSFKAFHVVGGAGSTLEGAAIGVSAIGRRFSVNEFKATSVNEVRRNGYGWSFNALIPVVPATKQSHANALTLLGDYVIGGGIADLYSGLSGGVSQPRLPNPTNANPAPTYTPNVDNGLVMFKSDGTLHPVRWTSYGVGAQYFLPPSGKVFLIASYSHLHSDNAHAFGTATAVFDKQDFFDGNLFVDVTPAVRLGVDIVWLRQTYVDTTQAKDIRGQFSGYFIF